MRQQRARPALQLECVGLGCAALSTRAAARKRRHPEAEAALAAAQTVLAGAVGHLRRQLRRLKAEVKARAILQPGWASDAQTVRA
jgi:hypothetical protein